MIGSKSDDHHMIMMFPVRLVLEEAAATRSVRDEDQAATTWMLVEPAVDPSTHPCLATMASLPRLRSRWVGGCSFVLGNDARYYELRWNRWVRSARRSSVLSPAASSRGKQGSGRKTSPGTDRKNNKQGLHNIEIFRYHQLERRASSGLLIAPLPTKT